MKTDEQLVAELDENAVFAARMRIVRARTSLLLADVRDMCDPPILATNARESDLRLLETAVANAMHFVRQLKRAAT